MGVARQTNVLLAGVVLALTLVGLNAGTSAGYDNYAVNNLQRSRDALLGQRAELQRARNDVLEQVDKLNARAARIDSYLNQVDDSLRDVNNALSSLR